MTLCKFFIDSKKYLIVLIMLLISTVVYGQRKKAKNGMGIYSPNFYPVLAWNYEKGIPFKGLAGANFNIGGFISLDDLAQVEKVGLKAIVMKDLRLKRSSFHKRMWRSLSDKEIDSTVKNLIGKTANNDAVVGYFLTDEPSALDFQALGKAVKAVKKYAPGKLAYINLYPNRASHGGANPKKTQLGTQTYEQYLERYVEQVHPQFISYDNYAVQYSMDLKDKQEALTYYTNLLAVRRVALKHNLPYWNVVASRQLRERTTIPSLTNMCFQAYTSLAAGYDGISWFTYSTHHPFDHKIYSPIDEGQSKTLTWYYLKEVNRQILALAPIMKRFTSTGVYFTYPAPGKSLPVLPGKVVQSVQSDEPMMVGEFVNNKETRYVMVVNLSLERSVKFTVSIKRAVKGAWAITAGTNKQGGALKKSIIRSKDTKAQDNRLKKLWLRAGEGKLIKIGY